MAARGSSSAEIIVLLVLHAQGLSTWRYKGNGDVTWFVPEVGQLWVLAWPTFHVSPELCPPHHELGLSVQSSVVSQCVSLSV